LQKKITELISAGVIESAHDVSEGGLFVTLCEAGFNRELGFAIETKDGIRKRCLFIWRSTKSCGRYSKSFFNEKFEKLVSDFPHERLGWLQVVKCLLMMISGEQLTGGRKNMTQRLKII
jgi:phosphoribosylformylglycinamidine synthase